MRLAVGVEYRGTAFSGWQSQSGARTVQDCVELALSRVADHPVRVVPAGRTDTGVHATGQVAHFDTPSSRREYSWMRGANSCLPQDVRVLWVKHVPDDFHARFRAVERSYRYIICVAAGRPAILGDLCAWSYEDLKLQPMRRAARSLLGEHDFSAFRAAGCQAKTPRRTVTALELAQSGPWFWLDISADAFLQHMVRNIAGTLMVIGRGEQPPEWMSEVLEGRDRTRAGPAAPPEALYLSEVKYPSRYDIPAPMARVRFW